MSTAKIHHSIKKMKNLFLTFFALLLVVLNIKAQVFNVSPSQFNINPKSTVPNMGKVNTNPLNIHPSFQGQRQYNNNISVTLAEKCEAIKDMVKSTDSGTNYSISSDAISKVSFHELSVNSSTTYYFAIVTFTSSYGEYIYKVESNTESNYSNNYLLGAGEAFWKYIQPYSKSLGCSPNL